MPVKYLSNFLPDKNTFDVNGDGTLDFGDLVDAAKRSGSAALGAGKAIVGAVAWSGGVVAGSASDLLTYVKESLPSSENRTAAEQILSEVPDDAELEMATLSNDAVVIAPKGLYESASQAYKTLDDMSEKLASGLEDVDEEIDRFYEELNKHKQRKKRVENSSSGKFLLDILTLATGKVIAKQLKNVKASAGTAVQMAPTYAAKLAKAGGQAAISNPYVTAGTVLAVVVVGGVGYYIYSPPKDKENTTDPKDEENTTDR